MKFITLKQAEELGKTQTIEQFADRTYVRLLSTKGDQIVIDCMGNIFCNNRLIETNVKLYEKVVKELNKIKI